MIGPTGTFAIRSRPSYPGFTSMTLPSGQFLRNVSREITTSPVCISGYSWFQFFRWLTHSRSQRCQKCRWAFKPGANASVGFNVYYLQASVRTSRRSVHVGNGLESTACRQQDWLIGMSTVENLSAPQYRLWPLSIPFGEYGRHQFLVPKNGFYGFLLFLYHCFVYSTEVWR